MKLDLKTSITLIVLSFIIGIVGAIPMIFNADDTWLLPSVIISNALLIIGIVGIVRRIWRKE